jgi:hypothetical protein
MVVCSERAFSAIRALLTGTDHWNGCREPVFERIDIEDEAFYFFWGKRNLISILQFLREFL